MENLSGPNITKDQSNPLVKHFRQPKIYLKLPSKGLYWADGSLDMPESGELPVYPMTAKDEITMKTPDALLNGQSTVDIIQSCLPNIKNAWAMPSIDLDAILIAIRIASYGEKMSLTIPIPKTDMSRDFEIDLRQLLDTKIGADFPNVCKAGDFLVEVKPMTYRTYTNLAIKTFEEQRIFSIVSQEDMDQAKKLEQFQKSFANLTKINLETIIGSVVAIKYQDEEPVNNPQHIKEFLENCETKVFDGIKTHIEGIRKVYETEPFKASATDEELAAGAPKTFEVPITFDQSNFFVSGS